MLGHRRGDGWGQPLTEVDTLENAVASNWSRPTHGSMSREAREEMEADLAGRSGHCDSALNWDRYRPVDLVIQPNPRASPAACSGWDDRDIL
jgi:hypothetical protein